MRQAPAPWQSIHVDAQIEVRQPDGATRLFRVVDGSVTAKAMEDRTGDYVLDVSVPADKVSREWFSCMGQTARIRWVLTSHGQQYTIWSNVFLLESWEDDGDGLLTVTAHGLLSRVWDHQDASARQWRAALARDVITSILAVDGVPCRTAPDLPRDDLPRLWTQGTDRWQAVLDLLEAVSGVLREDEWGAVLASQPGEILSRPEIVVADGESRAGMPAVVVSVPRSFDRTDRPNHIIVRGTDAFTEKDYVAEAVERDGPFRPDMYGWVTEEINSDTIIRLSQAQLVATNTLVLRRRYRQVLSVQMVTDWRVMLDDPIEVQTGGHTWWGRVVGVEMPITGDGVMTVEVGVE